MKDYLYEITSNLVIAGKKNAVPILSTAKDILSTKKEPNLGAKRVSSNPQQWYYMLLQKYIIIFSGFYEFYTSHK